jgi:pSer/pThr/pTyr-binding forkhead associated (FHA) protein
MLDESLVESMNLRTRLELEYQGQTLEIDEFRPSITLGRQSHNDVVVNDNRVSRTHAYIESRGGKFILIDQSTNGTYALIQGKKSVTLKGDEVQLIGKGVIALGQEVDADSPDMIHFAIKF